MYSNKDTDLIYRISMRSESGSLQNNSGTQNSSILFGYKHSLTGELCSFFHIVVELIHWQTGAI